MRSITGIALAALALLVLVEGTARAQSLSDPRAFGFVPGRTGALVGGLLGLAGVAAAIWLAAIRRFHARRWLRPWFAALAIAAPLLLVGTPLLAGSVASHYLAGDPVADQLTMAATRFIALAAGAGWLIYEIMAAVRQHEHDLYAEQRPQDRFARIMRTSAALLGVLLMAALVSGVSVTGDARRRGAAAVADPRVRARRVAPDIGRWRQWRGGRAVHAADGAARRGLTHRA